MFLHHSSRGSCVKKILVASIRRIAYFLVFCWTRTCPVSVILFPTVKGSVCKWKKKQKCHNNPRFSGSFSWHFLAILRTLSRHKEQLNQMNAIYSLKMYFCLAWQNRRGLWAAMKVSSEVSGAWGGRICILGGLNALLEVESFQSGETQVRGTKLFFFLPCAMNKLWSHLQSKKSAKL